ncbi:MAG TPA: alpha/beta hydrolase [Novosphingobium sp.]|nr:alpha/beta hydrolase [Novosphingobium sp.]HMP55840.1 alpha/beta hydrolase [Novosphingobium sp.]
MSNSEGAGGPQRDETVSVWNDQIRMRVRIAGSGPPLVYFHPAAGLQWDAFLDALAQSHTVYAPELPGTTPGDPYAIYRIDAYSDLVLLYEEALRKLGVKGAVAVGQSMGGMIACDLAAVYPDIFTMLVCLAPVGLWRDDAPPAIAELYASSPDRIPGFVFHDPSSPAAQAMFALPSDPDQIPAAVSQAVWTLGCAGKFLWPFPEHGLRGRLHRIAVPTLVLWGRDDRLVPAVHAQDFQAGISDCSVRIYEDCGHVLQVEQLDRALDDVRAFIG